MRLRNSDGINLTKAGKTKLAFYVERELRRIPSLANAAAVALLPGLGGETGPLTPQYDPAKTGRTIVISLDGPMVDGGLELEGGGDILAGEDEEGATSYELVVNGLATNPVKGRVDYAWGPSSPETDDASKNAEDGAADADKPEEPTKESGLQGEAPKRQLASQQAGN